MAQNIIVVGPQQAGKTFLLNHLTRSYFEPFKTDSIYQPTIGIDLVGTNVVHNISYVYWDSSGQERFIKITKPFFHKSDVIMIVFDLSSNNFQDLKKWYDLANCSDKPTLIVGTKHDLVGEGSETLLLAAIKFCQEHNCPFYPTSSVSGMGITELRNALQLLIPKEHILEQAQTKNLQGKRSSSVRGLFSCFHFFRKRGYKTVEEQSLQNYPTDLSVSV
tara:strand:- start:1524 stop:2180 length:657 start_codon:yes stop_codon:yes gene_type:complete